MNSPKSLLSLVVMLCLFFGGIAPLSVVARSKANNPHGQDDKSDDEGLQFRLSEAPDQPETRNTPKLVPATVLSDAETARVLQRLPPITSDSTDESSFALRERSLPPPRTGKTIPISFTSREVSSPVATAAGPLEVTRYSPQGDVPIAPNLSVTFSQPMVAVSSQEEVALKVPVKLSPEPPGKWRWVGTTTLLFEPETRFAMATEFTVTVPAGTRSATGLALPQAKSWTFKTPPPKITQSYPANNSKQRRDPLMFIEFDQRVEPDSIIKKIKIDAAGKTIAVRLASDTEISADVAVAELVKRAQKDRWVVFRPVAADGDPKAPLPGDSPIKVTFEAGAPSAEGPLTTTAKQEFNFSTYGPLKLISFQCGYNQGCRPTDQWLAVMSNPLDSQAFADSQIRVEPGISQLHVSAYGNTINIAGYKTAETTFKLILDKSIRDTFGQTLGHDETITVRVTSLPSSISLAGDGFVVLDPAGAKQLPLYSINFQKVRLRLYSVQPEDWFQFNAYRRARFEGAGKNTTEPRLPGRLVIDKQLDLKISVNRLLETQIDLLPGLTNGLGHVLVIVDAVTPSPGKNQPPLIAWVQATNIGLDAFADKDELVGWANSLKDGAPLSGVQLTLLPSRATKPTGKDGLAQLPLAPPTGSAGVPPAGSRNASGLLIARRGLDVALLPEHHQWWNGPSEWIRQTQKDSIAWYVFDDRKLYRPGEEVHVKGWMRRIGGGKNGDVESLNGEIKTVSYLVKDGTGNEIVKGIAPLNLFGAFDLAVKLPPTMNLGDAQLDLATGLERFEDSSYTHRFQVQEFRRPEFEVTTKTETEGPTFVGDHGQVSVTANYFSGGGLANADVKWHVTARPTNFTPPNRDDFTFGKWIPWWGDYSDDAKNTEKDFSGHTDGSGKHRLRIDFDSVKPPRPSTVTAEASVQDVNRQTWTSSATLLVHPSNLYVGLKSDKTFVQQGEPLMVQSIVTDLDGKAISNRNVRLRAVRLDWKQVKGEWQEVEMDPQDCSVQSGTDAVNCTFTTKAGGRYRVTAIVHDDRDRANESELTLWVSGGKRQPKEGVDEEQVELIPDRKEYKAGDTAQVLVQAPFYPAEAVMTLRRSGIAKVEYFRVETPTYTLRVPIEDSWTPNIHVQVDLVGTEKPVIPSANSPNTQDAIKDSGKKPAAGGTPVVPVMASGEINLSIPPVSRRLSITATPKDKTLEPGGNSVINIEAKDASGKPVNNGEVAVVVVDESVLALINYKAADPLESFYSERDADTSDYHLRSNILLTSIAQGVGIGAGAAGGAGGGGLVALPAGPTGMAAAMIVSDGSVNGGRTYSSFARAQSGRQSAAGLFTITGDSTQAIQLRENFNALAVFAPSVRTDANGRAEVKVKLPDNLTRYRVMAIAVAGAKQFGMGESAITARLPLMARPSAPRFLNFGDRFELPIVVQNQTDNALTVDLAVRSKNADVHQTVQPVVTAPTSNQVATAAGQKQAGQSVIHMTGRRITVPPNDRVEVRIPASAISAGTARFQIGAFSGNFSDAAEVELPVWTPATTEAFATYGEIDSGAINQPFKAPANVFSQFGGLQVETSSTQLQQLTDAFMYLQNYPFECSEQLASRIISVAALRDVLTAFKTKDLPTPQAIEASMSRDLKRLQGMQNDDGGFGFWQRRDDSWPFLSIHVAHALARARQKRFDVPKEMFDKSQAYLRQIEQHIPATYSPEARRAVIAYALYVRAQMNDRDPAQARKLMADAKLENLSLETAGWLLSVLSGDANSTTELEAIRRHLNNRVTETAADAHFVCSYKDSDYLLLNSDRRADGVILEALIGDQPSNLLIPKIVRGLLDNRTNGRWENTQENVFILLALDRYFNTFEKITPNFVSRVWLGNAYAGEQQFKGRSVDRQQVNVPMSYLAAKPAEQNLIMNKEGDGRLYYRIGMKYAPADLNLKAADYGFTVVRTYEAVDHSEDVRSDADGTWHIKAGSRVRVRLTMVAQSRRYHVALTDPLPAGLESLNPVLATTESLPPARKTFGYAESIVQPSPSDSWWRWRPQWFEYQNLRDERAEAFTSLLWEGVYNYSYIARATTPGIFVVPPSKAEEMYHPETFGRGKTDRVVVE